MKRVTDHNAVLEKISKMLGSCTTNGILDRGVLERETAGGTLFSYETEDGLFLLRRRSGFSRMNFYVKSAAALKGFKPDGRTVTEIPYRAGPDTALMNKLDAAGWKTVLKRVRLKRNASPLGEEPPMPDLRPGTAEALFILESCFSPLTACLPTEKELEEDIAEGRLLYTDGGLLRFSEKGNVTEIRHLAVLPENRGRGIADLLLRRYLSQNGGRISRVWTGADNMPALHLYKKSGYTEDGWNSSVLVIEP